LEQKLGKQILMFFFKEVCQGGGGLGEGVGRVVFQTIIVHILV